MVCGETFIWLHLTVAKLRWDSVGLLPIILLVFQPSMRFNMGKLTLKSETFDIRHPKLQSHPSLRVISLTRKSHIFLYHHGN